MLNFFNLSIRFYYFCVKSDDMKLKNYLIFGIVIVFSKLGISQKFNQHALQFSIGNHAFLTETQTSVRYATPTHFQLGYKYSFNNRFGLLVDMGYDQLIWKRRNLSNSHFFRFNIQPTINLSEVLGISQLYDRVGLILHAGVGLSRNSSQNAKIGTQIEGVPSVTFKDRMGNFIIGIAPQFSINENWSIFADATYIVNVKQQMYFDMQARREVYKAVGGSMTNFSIGVNFYPGAKQKHADWFQTPTIQKDDVYRLLSLESEIEELQAKLDDYDHDGVINAIDLELNTLPGAKVDARGVTIKEPKAVEANKLAVIDTTGLAQEIIEKLKRNYSIVNIDTDKDGVPDDLDLCPELPGSFKGCPDSDGDEIPDVLDKCPFEKGMLTFSGCPDNNTLKSRINEIVKPNVETIDPLAAFRMNKDSIGLKKFGAENIYFGVGSSTLTLEHMDKLNIIAQVLRANPNLSVVVVGYADNSGNPANNEKIAKKRSDEALLYLVQQGITSDRIIGSFKVVPVDTKNPGMHRRVNFSLKKN